MKKILFLSLIVFASCQQHTKDAEKKLDQPKVIQDKPTINVEIDTGISTDTLCLE